MPSIVYRLDLSKSTILIESETRQLLRKVGRKEQTYDMLIRELVVKPHVCSRCGETIEEDLSGSGLAPATRLTSSYTEQPAGEHSYMSHPSDQIAISSRFDKNISNVHCEAYRCNNKATNQITVNVGRLGEINLNLCNSCVPIFKNTDKLTALPKQSTFGRMADPDDILLSTS